jgi:hypothetical protein
MSVRVSTTDEQTSAQARLVVSLNYVQTLRRELALGQLDPIMFEDYLARLEGHLLKVEHTTAALAGSQLGPWPIADSVVNEDMLLSEDVLRS